jgi:hypothetical protein
MRAIPGVAAALGLVLVMGSTAFAQDNDDIAAWSAMMLSPYGALPPLVTPAMFGSVPTMAGRSPVAFEVKYGRWSFGEPEEPWNIFGLGARAGAFGFTAGYGKCSDCGDGVLMGSVEFERTLVTSPLQGNASTSAFAIGVRPSVGFGKAMGDAEGTAISAAIDLPFSLSAPVGTGFRIAPFVAPGFGYGRLTSGDDVEGEEGEEGSGTRASLAAGVGFLTPGGFAAHLTWRKIFIEQGPSTLGIGVSFGR